ncbi:hypothetical protein Tsubulata_020247 [Turnera subulata]|uniref:Uncharacterized protein n=1 Tax=Turnera subulata TaxID=218843 RepID=A0A9Q0JPQ9_9ROSI|nr:hypothetical protein Tsubulata_020247 [Turnera subulata]
MAKRSPDPDDDYTGSEEKADHESTMADDDTGSDYEEVDDDEEEEEEEEEEDDDDDEYSDSPPIPFRETLDEVHGKMYDDCVKQIRRTGGFDVDVSHMPDWRYMQLIYPIDINEEHLKPKLDAMCKRACEVSNQKYPDRHHLDIRNGFLQSMLVD